MGDAPSGWEVTKILLLVFGLYGIFPAWLVYLNWTELPVSDKWHWIITGMIFGVEGICIYVKNPFKKA